MDKPFQRSGIGAGAYQKSPFRRCFKPRPPLSAGCAGFASGCRSSVSELWRPRFGVSRLLSDDLAPGGCPASCPDAHRPTHGHRHVRNRAAKKCIEIDSESTFLVESTPTRTPAAARWRVNFFFTALPRVARCRMPAGLRGRALSAPARCETATGRPCRAPRETARVGRAAASSRCRRRRRARDRAAGSPGSGGSPSRRPR